MRYIPPALAAHLAGDVLTLATIVQITRRDGVKLGFTSTDHDLTYLGDVYETAGGVGGSAIQSKLGTGVDNLDVFGVLGGGDGAISSERITEDDIDAGLYDDAQIVVRLVNYKDLSQGHVELLNGRLGQIEVENGQFKTQVLGLTSRLNQTVGDTLSPTCRARLGDKLCKKPLTGSAGGYPIRATRNVGSASSGTTFTVSSESATPGHYTYGTAKFLTGLNAGLVRDIKKHEVVSGTARIVTLVPFPYTIAPGDQVQLTAGCDKKFATCQAKFANANNFRGEERIPTNDKASKIGRA